jgi:hypothetical protein
MSGIVNKPISLRAYYGKVWNKATHLEDGKWRHKAIAEIVVGVLGMLIWGYFLGFDRTIEARTVACLFLGSGLILTGFGRFVACLLRAPHQIYLEDQTRLFGTEAELQTAIADRDTALHAFDDDRYKFVKSKVDPLPMDGKVWLNTLLVRQLVSGAGNVWMLMDDGIVTSEPQGGKYLIVPIYRPIVQRLLRESGLR